MIVVISNKLYSSGLRLTRRDGKISARGGGGMADAGDLKSSVLTDVWVRIPPALRGGDLGRPFFFANSGRPG